MKISHLLSFAILFACLTIGCKNEDIPKQSTFFETDCRIKQFYHQNRFNSYYFVHYNSEGLPRSTSNINSSDAEMSYYYKFENQQLSTISQRIFGKEYLVYKYEYGIEGLNLIRRYELESFYDIDGTQSQVVKSYEVNQIRFKYGKSGKPSSMTLSSVKNDTINNTSILTDMFTSDFEYDERGNLVKEINYAPDNNKKMQVSTINYHKYDTQINSLKPLHYLLFEVFYSAPYMFSKNNKIATQTTNPFETRPEIKYDIRYDPAGYVTKDGLIFSQMVWQCP